MAMFAVQCRGEAFASLGMNACMPIIANASPLLFQKTKLLQKLKLLKILKHYLPICNLKS
ncbi:MAG: hypothetical protein CV087_00800 [Candidatus Brocadia sp. WS118]|nr:MAG: hypothetical protein CV087_00800 [Candidatus Brocadia sp. WS118]